MSPSPTAKERAEPDLLAKSPARRRRVAQAAGKEEEDVSRLVAEFTQMKSRVGGGGVGRLRAWTPFMRWALGRPDCWGVTAQGGANLLGCIERHLLPSRPSCAGHVHEPHDAPGGGTR